MSRFCLAFKTIFNKGSENKTLIFDEIDSGIGGNTGSEVGKKIAKISKNSQVICITHLAQIASFADKHFRILKSEIDNKTITSISCLTDIALTEEISRMIGSIYNNNFACMHSKELLNEAENYKLSLLGA